MSVARSRYNLAVGPFVASLVVALAEPPVGEPSPAPLEWRAPAECPDAAHVADAIASVTPSTVGVRVEVVRDGAELVAEVAIAGVDGPLTRTLRSPSCESIVEAVALLAQLAGESHPLVEVPPPQPIAAEGDPGVDPVPPTVPPPDTGAAAPPRETRARPTPISPRAELRAAAIVGAGTVPRIDAGARATIGIVTRWMHVELGGQYLAPLSTTAVDGGVRLRVQAWAVIVRACPTLPLLEGRLELGICGIVGAGQIRGSADGPALRASGRGAQPMLLLAIGPELAVAVARRVRVFAGLEVGGRPIRPGFQIGGLGPMWLPRPWAVDATAGLAVRLP